MDEPGRRVGDGAGRGERFEIEVDGAPLPAFPGETVATVLIAAGRRGFRRTGRAGMLRGVFCGIGLCFDCLVRVEDGRWVRACQTMAAPGLRIRTGTWRPDAGA